MKKTYSKPVALLVRTETSQMIATSLFHYDTMSDGEQLVNRDYWSDTDIWDNAGNW